MPKKIYNKHLIVKAYNNKKENHLTNYKIAILFISYLWVAYYFFIYFIDYNYIHMIENINFSEIFISKLTSYYGKYKKK